MKEKFLDSQKEGIRNQTTQLKTERFYMSVYMLVWDEMEAFNVAPNNWFPLDSSCPPKINKIGCLCKVDIIKKCNNWEAW